MDYVLDDQVTLLGTLKKGYGSEYDRLPRTKAGAPPDAFYLENGMFGTVDTELLWAMVRHVKPKRILEIGSGWTTALISQALARNADEGNEGEIVTVDPNPPGVAYNRPRVTLHARHLQEIGDLFSTLESGDMILVDSSHRYVTDGEIDLVLRALPGLKGVYVHFHDIFLPNDYPEQWLDRGYTEQEALAEYIEEHAEDVELLLTANWLHSEHPSALKGAVASYSDGLPIGPGSFWFRTRDDGKKASTKKSTKKKVADSESLSALS